MPSPAQHPPGASEMTIRQLCADVLTATGIRLDEKAAYLMRSVKAQLTLALAMEEDDTAAALVVRAIEKPLRDAEVKGPLTPDILRKILGKYGWAPFHAAIEQDEGEVRRLSSWFSQLGGAGNGGASPAAANDSTGGFPRHPLDGINEPSGATPAVRRRDPSQQDTRPSAEAAVRRREDASVRHIGSAPPRGGAAAPATRPAQGTGRAPPAAQDDDRQKPKPEQVKVHGSKAALTIEFDTTRGGEPTLRIEAARMLNPAERTYDWGKKVAVQLTPTELQVVAMVLFGMLPSCRFSNHGPEQDKWFEIVNQDGQYAGTVKVVVGKGQDLMLVQTSPADLCNLNALVLRRVTEQLRFRPEATAAAMAVLKRGADQHRAREAQRPQRDAPRQQRQAGAR